MDYIHSHSCIRFLYARTDDEIRAQGFPSHVRFEVPADSGVCNSHVGNIHESPQTINLGSRCFEQTTILHEILHALGFQHEHVRKDRDDYVIIDKDKLRE